MAANDATMLEMALEESRRLAEAKAQLERAEEDELQEALRESRRLMALEARLA